MKNERGSGSFLGVLKEVIELRVYLVGWSGFFYSEIE